MEAAVRQLDDATVISWQIVEDDGPATVAIRLDSLPEPLGGLAVSAGTDTELLWATVTVDPDVPARWLMLTLLHELGHVAGLDHNDDPRSVMNAVEVPWRKYQPVDLARLAAVECRP